MRTSVCRMDISSSIGIIIMNDVRCFRYAIRIVQSQVHIHPLPTSLRSEYSYKISHSLLRILRDTLRNPRNVPDFLLLQLHIRIKHTILKLL